MPDQIFHSSADAWISFMRLQKPPEAVSSTQRGRFFQSLRLVKASLRAERVLRHFVLRRFASPTAGPTARTKAAAGAKAAARAACVG